MDSNHSEPISLEKFTPLTACAPDPEMHQSALSRPPVRGDDFITKCYQSMRLTITTEIISRNLTLFYNMLAHGFSASIGTYSLSSAAPHFVVPNATLVDEFSESDKSWVR